MLEIRQKPGSRRPGPGCAPFANSRVQQIASRVSIGCKHGAEKRRSGAASAASHSDSCFRGNRAVPLERAFGSPSSVATARSADRGLLVLPHRASGRRSLVVICDSAAHPRCQSARRERATRTRRPVWRPVRVRGVHRLLVLYPPPSDPDHFRSYYEDTHLPLVAKFPGLRGYRYSFDVSAGEGESPYYCCVRGRFRRCGGAECGAGIHRRSGSARGRPELRYRRRHRAELRTPRRLSRSSEPLRPCPCAPTDRATNATLTAATRGWRPSRAPTATARALPRRWLHVPREYPPDHRRASCFATAG